MVCLAFQSNKIIQKYQYSAHLTVLYHFMQHFQVSGWSSNSALMETGQKVRTLDR